MKDVQAMVNPGDQGNFLHYKRGTSGSGKWGAGMSDIKKIELLEFEIGTSYVKRLNF